MPRAHPDKGGLAMIVIKKVLVPMDFDKASDEALIYGRHLAKTFGADLHVMHVAENLFPPDG